MIWQMLPWSSEAALKLGEVILVRDWVSLHKNGILCRLSELQMERAAQRALLAESSSRLPDDGVGDENQVSRETGLCTQRNADPNRHDAMGILRLPPEVFLMIVTFASNLDVNAPFKLSHVQSGTRRLIINCPSLWSTIDILFGLERCKEHLRRSGDVPLQVRTLLHAEEQRAMSPGVPLRPISSAFEQLVAFRDIIAPHLHRIVVLDIASLNNRVVQRFQEIFLDPSFSMACTPHTLNIRVINRFLDGRVELLVPRANRRFAARNIGLEGMRIRGLEAYCDLVTTRILLRDFQGSCSDLYAALHRATNLETLVVEDGILQDGQDQPALTMASLRSIQFRFIDVNIAVFFNQSITAPNLRSLSIATNATLTKSLTVLDLLEPLVSGGTLESLHLVGSELTKIGRCRWLGPTAKPIKSLKVAHFNGCSMTADDLVHLNTVFPALEELAIDNPACLEGELDSDAVRNAVSLRAPRTLKKISLRGWDDDQIDPEVLLNLRNFGVEELVVDWYDAEEALDDEEQCRSEISVTDAESADGIQSDGDEREDM